MNGLDAVFESPIADVARDSDAIDCLVIGSGTAGVSTALSLARRGLRVVILEAGPLKLTSHIGNASLVDSTGLAAKLSDSTTIPTSWVNPTERGSGAQAEPIPAWLVVGGRTLFWTGTAPRYKPWDFADWPIDAADMSRYYDRAESLMKVSGNEQRPPFYQSAGQRSAIERLTAAGLPARPTPVGIDTGSERRVGAGFDSAVARLLACPQLGDFASGALVSLVAQAVAVRLSVVGDRVDGVEALDRRTGAHLTLRPRHVVLAGGAVQSARLALASGLDAVSPLVGRYINDHLFVQSTAEFPAARTDANMNVMVDATPERAFHLQIQGPFKGTWYHQSNSTMWVNCNPEGTHMMLAAFGVGSVEKDNRVVLTNRGDPRYGGIADFRVLYHRSAQDEKRLAAMEHALGQAAIALGSTPGKTQINPPGGALHEIGGLRMGADAASGVTDSHGRFWRIENLSAADASPFPSQGSANPYLTITAWSLRHADGVAQALGCDTNPDHHTRTMETA
ncbi:GMC oxidoreductase [Mycolicibacterium pulveris]|uniref:GMC oxidoreductase n=1 Tax=Mycolicibacterium pulveris TaxID=36813 RepID=UPI003CF3A0E6